jgi:hypothetical protein
VEVENSAESLLQISIFSYPHFSRISFPKPVFTTEVKACTFRDRLMLTPSVEHWEYLCLLWKHSTIIPFLLYIYIYTEDFYLLTGSTAAGAPLAERRIQILPMNQHAWRTFVCLCIPASENTLQQKRMSIADRSISLSTRDCRNKLQLTRVL